MAKGPDTVYPRAATDMVEFKKKSSLDFDSMRSKIYLNRG